MRQFLYGFGLLMAVALLVWIDRSPSDVANQVSLLMLLIGRTAGHRCTPMGVAFSPPSRRLRRGCARRLPHGRNCVALRDVADGMGRSSYVVDLDHSCRLRSLFGCRRSHADPTAAATASSELGAVQHDRNTC